MTHVTAILCRTIIFQIFIGIENFDICLTVFPSFTVSKVFINFLAFDLWVEHVESVFCLLLLRVKIANLLQ